MAVFSYSLCGWLFVVLVLPGVSCERLDQLFPASVHLGFLVFRDRSFKFLTVLTEAHVHLLSERLKSDLWEKWKLKSVARTTVC